MPVTAGSKHKSCSPLPPSHTQEFVIQRLVPPRNRPASVPQAPTAVAPSRRARLHGPPVAHLPHLRKRCGIIALVARPSSCAAGALCGRKTMVCFVLLSAPQALRSVYERPAMTRRLTASTSMSPGLQPPLLPAVLLMPQMSLKMKSVSGSVGMVRG